MRERKESGVDPEVSTGSTLATAEDLAGYGFPVDEEDEQDEDEN